MAALKSTLPYPPRMSDNVLVQLQKARALHGEQCTFGGIRQRRLTEVMRVKIFSGVSS
jgi:glycerol dehydrogenase-like iron-containing ADH family enzyme